MTRQLALHKFAAAIAFTTLLCSSAFAFDLLAYAQQTTIAQSHEGEPGIEPYNRLEHFGAWIDETPENGCYDTRARVLMRDSADPSSTQYSASNACTVVKSTWNDPYTGQTFKMANVMQIDHVVPLKNMYYAGAYTWSHNRRCHYANDLDNNFQLLAVKGSENMSKGDRGPDGYMPPNRNFQCQYLHIWLEVHAIWELQTTASELQAIRTYLLHGGCSAATTFADDHEIAQQRSYSQRNIARCPQ